MTRPPPRSTLSPYTTLSRSQRHRSARRPRQGRVRTSGWLALPAAVLEQPAILRDGHNDRRHRRSGSHRRSSPAGDRKSTRLNSSHSQISYAVFCLKKKDEVDIPFAAAFRAARRVHHRVPPLVLLPDLAVFRLAGHRLLCIVLRFMAEPHRAAPLL